MLVCTKSSVEPMTLITLRCILFFNPIGDCFGATWKASQASGPFCPVGPIALFSLHLTDMKIRRKSVLASLVLEATFLLAGLMEVCQARGFDNGHTLIFIRATTSSPYISIGNMIGLAQSASDDHRECWSWAYRPPSITQLSDR